MEHVKQTIRRLLQETLTIAQKLPVARRQQYIRRSLENIQDYCATYEKNFIVREITINCNQYELGGSQYHFATLFRGPNEDASVAICITEQGSLLHRNDSPWKVYCNAGDVNPVQPALAVKSTR
ncbi:hypothetical protein [Leptothoe spongobia]|uniref:Uncharacterized protein n=1 Tax=Leptothoe spongobia TAU-MAC 1115 TaxID=1967444 RepID=A0A947DEZ3_9CYAN|nr:hypothetical protein [Leptothoe spongobia]MBT9315892.1 hypothetical protein [Leptothoe spongobia TAU-MAC 1115]